jgi:hypothetical protein
MQVIAVTEVTEQTRVGEGSASDYFVAYSGLLNESPIDDVEGNARK